MKDKTSLFIRSFATLRARSQICFDTIVGDMLIMLSKKNTRNNILNYWRHARVRERSTLTFSVLNESIRLECLYSQIRDYLIKCICQCDD